MTDDDNWEDPNDLWRSLLEPVTRLHKDMRLAAATLSPDQARYMVDQYYAMQEDRKRAGGQQRASREAGEPHSIIVWLSAQSGTLEKQIKAALDVYTETHLMGSWMREVHGIGPVLSAGLLAHIYMGEWCDVCHGHTPADCERRQRDKKLRLAPHRWAPVEACPTVGHLWSFAGWAADGQKAWAKGAKRPYNTKFRTLLWKCGQSFMKFSNHPNCYYGRVYRVRKAFEQGRNERGELAAQAAAGAARVGKDTDAYQHYSMGQLPPAHIDARARRYAVKLFLAHLHGEWYERQYGRPAPLPYPVAHMGHAHIVPRPAAQ